ncbi:unnamed protein product [Mytilus coruscus]|uniref:G-protein coupled receptors family 1 profile domain-containing protein n=1 Tax=Mytilus coruscus TaxID=42192 RepID=A0A6J8DWX4_MYTCO|nr:unnamed protein product [Mytilus coruscus]
MKTVKDGQYFIPYLAVADLLGNIICSLFGLSMTLMPITYEFDALCKFGWLLATWTFFLSVFLLVTIAIQRYLKICRRKGPKMTLKWKKIIMMCALLLSTIVALPSVFITGSIPFQNINRNVTGFACGTISGNASFIYNVVVSTSVSLSCGLIIVPYCLIVRKTHRYLKKGNQCEVDLHSYSKNRISENQTKEHSFSTLDMEIKTEYSIPVQSSKHQYNKILLDLEKLSLRNNRKSIKKLPKTNQRMISQITKTFMIITLIFIMCYISKITITILETLTINFLENDSDIERLGIMFVHQGYIMNSIANPFIYTFFDAKFNTEIKNMFCRSIFAR